MDPAPGRENPDASRRALCELCALDPGGARVPSASDTLGAVPWGQSLHLSEPRFPALQGGDSERPHSWGPREA